MLTVIHDLSGSERIQGDATSRRDIYLLVHGIRRHYRRDSWTGLDMEPKDDSIVDYVGVSLDADTAMSLVHAYWTSFTPPNV